MIQIYHGDGKGKTTASVGLAVRAAGRGLPVLFAQFLKDDSSGEICVLKNCENIDIMHPHVFHGFVSRMSEIELQETKVCYEKLLTEIEAWVEDKRQENILEQTDSEQAQREIKLVVILDEVLHALHYELLEKERFISFLQKYKDVVEFILTGRNPSEDILALADYVTEMKKCKHPFDCGVTARYGIEM